MTDQELARLLLDARHAAPVPAKVAPADAAQAVRVQRLVMAQLGAIGGWKVGAPGPDAAPSCAPMPASGLFAAPHVFDSAVFTQRDVESEIFFRLGTDLPPRATPYTRDDILAAIAFCQPGIEILQSRLADPDAASPVALLADLIQHGAYVWGTPIEGWADIDFAALAVTQTITGGAPKTATGNPAGDMIRLLVWLANEGAVWAGGLKACPADGEAIAAFAGASPVVVRFTAGS
jgi:2-keto-4-pentenoate hydratase